MDTLEKLLGYRFQKKELLEVALTHSSYIDSVSYEILEFVGDAALGLAISKDMILIYREIDTGQFPLLRSVNISTERLARVAVRHRLYSYVRRRNVAALDDKVRVFTEAVQQDDDKKVYGGDVKAPKILADVVKSLAGAVYCDCQYDLNTFWRIFEDFLGPMVPHDVLQQQPQPVNQKEKAKLHAAKVAEQKLCPNPSHSRGVPADEFQASSCFVPGVQQLSLSHLHLGRSQQLRLSHHDFMVDSVSTIDPHPNLLKDCINTLNSLEDIDDAAYTKTLKLMRDDVVWRKVFLELPDHRKRGVVMNL